MSTERYFLAGLPGSGKSSFLAAFWVYANGAPHPSLSVESFPADADYLAELQQHWFDYTAVPRTPASVDRSVSLTVKRNSDQRTFDLHLPDLSGESFGHIWSQRHWSDQFQSIVNDASGALLFVHPREIEDGATLHQAQALAAAIDGGEAVDDPAEANQAAPSAPWDIAKAPTQIKLIDSLQLIAEHATLRQPFRLGLVVSAWDLVLAQDSLATPASWLKGRMPCLMQFLQANDGIFETTVFGISAQGGDYGSPTPKFQNSPPYDRCIVAGDSVTSPTDVTAPVHWLVR